MLWKMVVVKQQNYSHNEWNLIYTGKYIKRNSIKIMSATNIVFIWHTQTHIIHLLNSLHSFFENWIVTPYTCDSKMWTSKARWFAKSNGIGFMSETWVY